MEVTGDVPSARAGHSLTVGKNFLPQPFILFIFHKTTFLCILFVAAVDDGRIVVDNNAIVFGGIGSGGALSDTFSYVRLARLCFCVENRNQNSII